MASLADRLDHDPPARPFTPASEPRVRRFPVLLFALLGYAYPVALFAIALAVALATFFVMGWRLSLWLIAPAIGALALILAAIRVKPPAPEGVLLTRAHAGPIYAATDELRLILRTPALDAILLTEEFAARVVQRPRLGLLGWSRHTLLVGLPLLQALTWDQLRALLAREMALAGGTPGWFDGWLLRRRLLWGYLLKELAASQPWWRAPFVPFYRWYLPRFLAYSAPLVAVQDLAADSAAAGAMGPRTTADALLNQAIVRHFLDHDFWPACYRQIAASAEPPEPYSALGIALRDGLDPARAGEWMQAGLHSPVDPDGPSTALSERIAALGQDPRVPPHARSAAEQLFTVYLPLTVGDLDRRWQSSVGDAWRDQHLYAQQTIASLRDLDEVALIRPLSPGEALQRARWTEEFGSPSEALARYREALDRDPERTEIAFAVGRLLLASGDASGIAMLYRAMQQDPDQTLPACALAVQFLTAHGRGGEAEIYRQRAHHWVQLLQAARAERQGVWRGDTLAAHWLNAEQLAWIVGNLATFPAVERAYLARKVPFHLPDSPVYVLGLVLDASSSLRPWRRSGQSYADAITVALDPITGESDTYLVATLGVRNGWLKEALERTPESAIYQR